MCADYPVAAEKGAKYKISKLAFEGWMGGEPPPNFNWTSWFASDGTYHGPRTLSDGAGGPATEIQPLFNYKSLITAKL